MIRIRYPIKLLAAAALYYTGLLHFYLRFRYRNRALKAIPCFDQPDLKARWTVSLEHPAQWSSLGYGAELERVVVGDRARVRFAATKPIPTYLVSFVAGALRMETGVRDGRTLRMFHRETDAAKVRAIATRSSTCMRAR